MAYTVLPANKRKNGAGVDLIVYVIDNIQDNHDNLSSTLGTYGANAFLRGGSSITGVTCDAGEFPVGGTSAVEAFDNSSASNGQFLKITKSGGTSTLSYSDLSVSVDEGTLLALSGDFA